MNIEKTVWAIERLIEGASELYLSARYKDFPADDENHATYLKYKERLGAAITNLREASTIVSSL